MVHDCVELRRKPNGHFIVRDLLDVDFVGVLYEEVHDVILAELLHESGVMYF